MILIFNYKFNNLCIDKIKDIRTLLNNLNLKLNSNKNLSNNKGDVKKNTPKKIIDGHIKNILNIIILIKLFNI